MRSGYTPPHSVTVVAKPHMYEEHHVAAFQKWPKLALY